MVFLVRLGREDLAAEFKMRTAKAIKRLEELEKMGWGDSDGRGRGGSGFWESGCWFWGLLLRIFLKVSDCL